MPAATEAGEEQADGRSDCQKGHVTTPDRRISLSVFRQARRQRLQEQVR
jgi:hypothetical protein